MEIFGSMQFLSLLGSSIAAPTCALQSQPVVTIENGTLIGTQNPQYCQDFFLGIPYAQPPVGSLRYNHPQPLNQSWNKRRATVYGAWCHSAPLTLPGFSQKGFTHEESEDCLTLNVVRPSGVHQDTKLPALVWIHGGGLQEGGSADQRYNMSFLVHESVNMGIPTIGVSFNYRLSGFGFLQGRAVNESGVANLGLYDQRLALHWIQENIAAFGGDPSRVTIQGESAGGISVGHHFLAYGGRDDGLFRAGITESGGPLTSSALLSLDQQDVLYDRILNTTDCMTANDTLQCLRSRPADTLKSTFQGLNYYPVIDGGIVTTFPSVALKKGRFVKHPILIGTNTNEGTSFSASGGLGVNNPTKFRAVVTEFDAGKRLMNRTVDVIVDEYLNKLSLEEAQKDLGTVQLSPSSEYGSLYGQVTLYVGDSVFNAARRYSAQMWGQYGVPAYSYRFDTVPNGILPQILGATHFQEVPFVFRNFDGVGYAINPLASNSTEVRQKYHNLSNLMSRMWLSFVNTLSPNAHHVLGFDVVWPAYSNVSAANMVFRLSGTNLEPDTWRSSAISRLISAFNEYKL